eukprot:10327047-Alexandrium_andersonii.AAC.1
MLCWPSDCTPLAPPGLRTSLRSRRASHWLCAAGPHEASQRGGPRAARSSAPRLAGLANTGIGTVAFHG